MLRMENVTKQYRHRGQTGDRAGWRHGAYRQGRFRGRGRPQRQRQEHAFADVGGMLSPSSGRVLLEGQSIYDLSSDRRAGLRKRKVGFVFQTFNLVTYSFRVGKRQGAVVSRRAGR